MELELGKELEVEFSFGIHWHPTEVIYDNRMELHSRSLIRDQPVEIHWLSIINSFVLVVLLTAFLAIIFRRNYGGRFPFVGRGCSHAHQDC